MNRILPSTPTPAQSGNGSNGILETSSISGASPSDCFVSNPGHLLGESYPSEVMESVYSAAPADWAKYI